MAKGKSKKKDERLGDLLIDSNKITKDQLAQSIQCQVLFGGRLGTNLLELGFVTEEDIREVLEKKYGTPSVRRPDLMDIPKKVIALVPERVAAAHSVVPLEADDKTIKAAMLDPWKESAVQAVTDVTQLKVEPLIALELDLLWALEKYYGMRRDARLANLDRWLELHREVSKKKKKKTATAPAVKKNSEVYQEEPLLPAPPDITYLEGAPRSLDDFWDRVGRSGHPEYHLPQVLKELEFASSREEIASVILDFSSLIFKRTVLFVVNEDMLFGLDARGEAMDDRLALAIMLPLARRSVFRTVVETSSYFLGPIPDSPINRRFTSVLGKAKPKNVVLLPVLIKGKVAAILYGDMGHGQAVEAKLSPIQSVLHGGAKAFERLILEAKKGDSDGGEREGSIV